MVTAELVEQVKERYLHGFRHDEILEQLMSDGYAEEDIDAAISEIQHQALKQLPVVSKYIQLLERFEAQSNLATPKMTVLLMIACVFGLLLLAGGLFLIYDPLGTRSTIRDEQRQTDMSKLQNALNAYYKVKHIYPTTLNNLVPQFLSKVPHDPQTGADYMYEILDNKSNFELCITPELQAQQCVSATPTQTSIIPVIPTDTPIPSFTPQSGGGVSSASPQIPSSDTQSVSGVVHPPSSETQSPSGSNNNYNVM